MHCPEKVVATILCSKSHKEWIIFPWDALYKFGFVAFLWCDFKYFCTHYELLKCSFCFWSRDNQQTCVALLRELAHMVWINRLWYESYLKLHVQVDGGAEVVEGDKCVPRDVDPVLHDPVGHLAGQVEDGVLVRLDGLGGVDDEDQRGVERTVGCLTKSTLRGLRAGLAPGCCCRDLRVKKKK